MRCKFCGGGSLHPDTQHKTFSTGKAVAGAVTFGVVGAAAGFIGKEKKGYRCAQCGNFMESAMDARTEVGIDFAIKDAEAGRDTSMYYYYKKQYPNIEARISKTKKYEEEKDSNKQVTFNISTEVNKNIKNSYNYYRWIPNCPVFIEGIIIKTNNEEDYLSLYAWNQSDRKIKSVYLDITTFDDAGDEINTMKCIYQNVNVAPNEQLPINKEFKLNNNITYSVNIFIDKIVLEDSIVWRNEDKDNEFILSNQKELNEMNFPRFKYLIKKLKYKKNVYMPIHSEEYRQCICGHPVLKGKKCSHCELNEDQLNNLLSQKKLEEIQRKEIMNRAVKRAEETSRLYDEAVAFKNEKTYKIAEKLKKENNEKSLNTAITLFDKIINYEDSKDQIEMCKQQIKNNKISEEEKRLQSIYDEGMKFQSSNKIDDINKAISIYESILDWKDSKEQIEICKNKIVVMRQKKKINKRVFLVGIFIFVGFIAFFSVYNTIILPSQNYKKGCNYFENEQYREAMEVFKTLGTYSDCENKYKEAKYQYGIALVHDKKYDEAKTIFEELKDYSQSRTYIYYIKILSNTDTDDLKVCRELLNLPSNFENVQELLEKNPYKPYAYYYKLSGTKYAIGPLNNVREICITRTYDTENGKWVYRLSTDGKDVINWYIDMEQLLSKGVYSADGYGKDRYNEDGQYHVTITKNKIVFQGSKETFTYVATTDYPKY